MVASPVLRIERQRAAGARQFGQIVGGVEIDDCEFLAVPLAALDDCAVILLAPAEFRSRLLHLPADARDVVPVGVVEDVVVALLAEIILAVLAASGIRDQAFAVDVVDEAADVDVAVMPVGMPGSDRQHDRFAVRRADQLDHADIWQDSNRAAAADRSPAPSHQTIWRSRIGSLATE